MVDDEEDRKIEWDGLPRSIEMNISQQYDVVKSYPIVAINMAIALERESREGLRPEREITNIVNSAI